MAPGPTTPGLTAADRRDVVSLHADARRVLGAWTAPDEEQERLRLRYLEHLAAHDDAMWRSCHPDHLTSSALIVGPGTQVLLVKHTKVGRWLQTGGHCEPADTTLSGVALREAREESGISNLTIDPVPLRLSYHRVACGPTEPAHHLDVQFLVVAPPGSAPVRGQDEDPVAWFCAHELPEPTDDEVRALVRSASSRRGENPRP